MRRTRHCNNDVVILVKEKLCTDLSLFTLYFKLVLEKVKDRKNHYASAVQLGGSTEYCNAL